MLPGSDSTGTQDGNRSMPCSAAAGFLYEHQATFVNSLRGDFFARYDLELLRNFVDNHACSELASTIQSIIDDRAT